MFQNSIVITNYLKNVVLIEWVVRQTKKLEYSMRKSSCSLYYLLWKQFSFINHSQWVCLSHNNLWTQHLVIEILVIWRWFNFTGGKQKCEEKLCLDFGNAFGQEWDDGSVTTMKVLLFAFCHLRNSFPHLKLNSRTKRTTALIKKDSSKKSNHIDKPNFSHIRSFWTCLVYIYTSYRWVEYVCFIL